MMLLATLAPKEPVLTLVILVAFFAVMNVLLFRAQIFKRRKKTVQVVDGAESLQDVGQDATQEESAGQDVAKDAE